MKKAIVIAAALLAIVLAGVQLHAEGDAAAEEPAAVEQPATVKDLLDGKTPEEAAELVKELLTAAIAEGGSEMAMQNRIVRLVASCIGAAGDNIEAVAASLAQAAGTDYCGPVVAAISVSAKAILADTEAVNAAAVGAVAEGDKETAEDASVNPYAYLGRVRAWSLADLARRWAGLGEVTTTTTATTTTTTTVPTPTPTGLR